MGKRHTVGIRLQLDSGKTDEDIKTASSSSSSTKSQQSSEDNTLQMPYSIQIQYNTEIPPSSPQCSVQLSTEMLTSKLHEGEATQIDVHIKNTNSNDDIGMVVAIVGLPGGMEARIERLKELVEMGKIAFFELIGGREIVFYWRGMAPAQEVSFSIDVTATVPGRYTGPASRAYLYYQKEFKHWNHPLQADITARQ